MCTSRKQMSGRCASNSSTASRPLRAWATISSSGQALASRRASASRSSGSSSAISAVGRATSCARLARAGNSISAHTPCGSTSLSAQLAHRRRRPAAGARAASRARCPVHGPVGLRPTPVSLTRTQAAAAAHAHMHLDAAALFARIDAVAHRVLDQRQQRHRRAAQARAAASTCSANCRRSGMRICISSR